MIMSTGCSSFPANDNKTEANGLTAVAEAFGEAAFLRKQHREIQIDGAAPVILWLLSGPAILYICM